MLIYIELKSDCGDMGPAWIGHAQLSRAGRTVYFNGKALKRDGRGASGNHIDLETGERYWVSGVKKRGTNRHWAGGGRVTIDATAVREYLDLVGEEVLDPSRFVASNHVMPADVSRFHQLENQKR